MTSGSLETLQFDRLVGDSLMGRLFFAHFSLAMNSTQSNRCKVIGNFNPLFRLHAHFMKRPILYVLFAATIPLSNATAKDPTDKVTAVDSEDADMKAAIANARSLLPHFWQTVDAPKRGERGFALKVRITSGGEAEHFWLTPIERKDGKIFGTINNDPNKVKTVKLGQRIEVPEPDITDWLYIREGKMIGNYTLRAMFKTMPPEQAESFKKKLGEP